VPIGIEKLLRGLWLLLLLTAGSACADASLRFYYFNPDSPQNNLGKLKSDMDSLLDGLEVRIAFQPFARLTDFHRGLRKDRPSFVFSPEWYLERYGDELRLRPLLQSIRDKRLSYRKLLISSQHYDLDEKKKARVSLAMTGLGPDSENILDKILFAVGKFDANRFSIVEVPKDADAIFAAALGQVDTALVSQASLEQLRTVNPRLIDSLKVLGESEPLAMPVLSFVDGSVSSETRERFSRFMRETLNSRLMQTLRIDGWSEHHD
jgi:hypothetical protein